MNIDDAKKLLKFCFDMQSKTDTIRDITKELYDIEDSTYHYGLGFSDGLEEAYSTIGDMVLKYVIDNKGGEEILS